MNLIRRLLDHPVKRLGRRQRPKVAVQRIHHPVAGEVRPAFKNQEKREGDGAKDNSLYALLIGLGKHQLHGTFAFRRPNFAQNFQLLAAASELPRLTQVNRTAL